MARKLKPIHPGKILKEEFLDEMGITPYRLAKSINVTQTQISEIIRGERSITAATALKLGKFFGVEPQSWINLQSRYDLEVAKDKLEKKIEKEVIPWEEAA